MWTTLIAPIPPYDFAHTREAARFLYAAGRVYHGAFRRALRADGGIALVEVTSHGTVDQPLLEARLLASDGSFDEAALVAKLRRLLNVESDLMPFYRAAAHDPFLRDLIAPLYGLSHFTADTLFESLALTIIEQQITLKMAQRAERWLMAWGGRGIDYEGESYYVFPDAAQIAAADVETLIPMKITGIRIRALIEIARRVASGALDLEAIRERPRHEVYRTLMDLKGIGHWTAAWTITRGLGDYVYVGSADVALRAAANRYFFGGQGRADAKLVDRTFARFGAHDGIAGYYTLMRWAFDKYGAGWES
jgi:DNA-3-methyladenine glycosylase II